MSEQRTSGSVAYWKVKVKGSAAILAHWYGEHRFLKEGEDYLCDPGIFADCSTVTQVRQRAVEELFHLNRYAATFLPTAGNVRLGEVSRVDEEGETQYVYVQAAFALASASVEVWIGEPDGAARRVAPILPELQRWRQLLKQDAHVAKVERLLGEQAHDWVNLVRVVEVMEHDLGGQAVLIAQGFTSKADRSRFGRSANHHETAGDLARHGVSKGVPPDDPMPLAEARAYVDRIRRRWLKIKLERLSNDAPAD